MTGHGNTNARFVLNNKVNAVLTLKDILKVWDESAKPEWTYWNMRGQKMTMRNHLLIIIDACNSGSWTNMIQRDCRRVHNDVSIQTSSSLNEKSFDDNSGAGGFFLNNLLFINGLKDVKYNDKYKTYDPLKKERRDLQRPTFFSRFPELGRVYRLKIGFNSWTELEWRVPQSFSGTFAGDNGDLIKGEFKPVQLHGQGEKRLANGRVEKGYFRNDKLDGNGVIEWENLKVSGLFDQGQLVEVYSAKLFDGTDLTLFDKPKGLPTHTLDIQDDMIRQIRRLNQTDQCQSVFEWVTTKFSNGDILEEMFQDGLQHGNSFYTRNDGSIIHRLFYRGGMHQSCTVDPDGNIEVTNLDDWSAITTKDKKSKDDGPPLNTNFGTDKKATSSLFRGKMPTLFPGIGTQFWKQFEFKNNEATKLAGKDGEYKGPSRDKNPEGEGVFVDKIGSTYTGQWKDGLPHGRGVYTHGYDGSRYDGFWKKGMRHGLGQMNFPDGSSYVGPWAMDQIWGHGKFTFPSRKQYTGFLFMFESGPFMKKIFPENSPVHSDAEKICVNQNIYGFVSTSFAPLPPLYPFTRKKVNPVHKGMIKAKAGVKSMAKKREPTFEEELAQEDSDSDVDPYELDEPQQDIYFGEVLNETYSGFGHLKTKYFDQFEGEFIEGALVVENQRFSMPDGSRYVGSVRMAEMTYDEEDEWEDIKENKKKNKKFKKHEKFVLVYKDTYKYECLQGNGLLKDKFGNVYKGEFRSGEKNGPGVMNFANGDVYDGPFSDDQPNGLGKYTLKDGTVYERMFVNGCIYYPNEHLKFSDGSTYEGGALYRRSTPKDDPNSPKKDGVWTFEAKHGNGEFVVPNKYRYEGKFQLDEFHGGGTLKLDNGESFSGKFYHSGFVVDSENMNAIFEDESVYNGQALVRLPNEDTSEHAPYFKGSLAYEAMHGQGKLEMPNGDVYEGNFEMNEKSGYGKLSKKDENVYEGLFFENTMNSLGTLKMPNGDVFFGEFYDGEIEGSGVYTTAKGDRFEGYFSQKTYQAFNQRIQLPGGSIYHGSCTMERLKPKEKAGPNCFRDTWRFLAMEGYGRLESKNGDVYEGQFSENKKEGFGRMVFHDKSVYQGNFSGDKFSGDGKYCHPTYSSVEGDFDENKLEGGEVEIYFEGGQYVYGFYDGDTFWGREFEDPDWNKISEGQELPDHVNAYVFKYCQNFPNWPKTFKYPQESKKKAPIAADPEPKMKDVVSTDPKQAIRATNDANVDDDIEFRLKNDRANLRKASMIMPVWDEQMKMKKMKKKKKEGQGKLDTSEQESASVSSGIDNLDCLDLLNFDFDTKGEPAQSEKSETLGLKTTEKKQLLESLAHAEKIEKVASAKIVDSPKIEAKNPEIIEGAATLENDADNDCGQPLDGEGSMDAEPETNAAMKEANKVDELGSVTVDELWEGRQPKAATVNELVVSPKPEEETATLPTTALIICETKAEAPPQKNEESVAPAGPKIEEINPFSAKPSKPKLQSTSANMQAFDHKKQEITKNSENSPKNPEMPNKITSERLTPEPQPNTISQNPPSEILADTRSDLRKESPSIIPSDKLGQPNCDPKLSHYEGFLVNNSRHGHGKLVFPGGSRYEGSFEHGAMSGLGSYYFKNGSVYTGRFVQNRFHGRGELTSRDASRNLGGYFIPLDAAGKKYQLTMSSGNTVVVEFPEFELD